MQDTEQPTTSRTGVKEECKAWTTTAADGAAPLNLPAVDQLVLAHWEEVQAFKTQLELSKHKPRFVFFDGPPFATGLPHYGHLLAGTVKDVVTRYYSQTGFYVPRRFGWDCHGLPVEMEVDKLLGVTSTAQVEAMGVAAYNDVCRGVVTRYAHEWETVVTRLGRWVDFRDCYYTMQPTYMESVWWVFKTLFEKGMVYKGRKVLPYSTGCKTVLSNSEASLNQKDGVSDPTAVVMFPVADRDDTFFLAWTTTPWTLPSNLALAVHPELTYVQVRDVATCRQFVLGKDALPHMFPDPQAVTVVTEFTGEQLVGLRYEPPFPHFQQAFGSPAFQVVPGRFVDATTGTGVVHVAPAFGEDDYAVCVATGVVTPEQELPCPVDTDGKFTPQVPEYAGLYFKDVDRAVLADLKACGRLFSSHVVAHTYPYCWRTDTPLMYRAMPSWFVRVEPLREKLLAHNATMHWVPTSVKEGRFHSWLRDARDWAVSRSRYWGTPLPVWVSDDGQEVVCVGSVAELEHLSGVRVTDLHRQFVDEVTLPSKMGKGVLRRVPDVFDCWFESGCMPYGQAHYPFENAASFESQFPGDFVAEGLDQTRGWFYSLLVLSTALFDKPAVKNVVVNGLVLASDGKKMSKSARNYPDPLQVTNEYGADAVRLYLVTSPAVHAEPLAAFSSTGVRAVVRDVFLPWYNALRFLSQCLSDQQYRVVNVTPFHVRTDLCVMDCWVLSMLQSLVHQVRCDMQAHQLHTVVPAVVKFLEQLTNWYLRLNRRRFKDPSAKASAVAGLDTLYHVMLSLTVLLAPFAPFFTEFVYQQLRAYHPGNVAGGAADAVGSAKSVHFLQLPQPDAELVDAQLEHGMSWTRKVVDVGRTVRSRNSMPLKTPLQHVVVVHPDAAVLAAVKQLQEHVMQELNVCELVYSRDEATWCTLQLHPDGHALGARLGTAMHGVSEAVKELPPAAVEAYLSTGRLAVGDVVLGPGDLRVERAFKAGVPNYDGAAAYDGSLVVAVHVSPDAALVHQATGREFVTLVQRLRKKLRLARHEHVVVCFELAAAVAAAGAPVDSASDAPDALLSMLPALQLQLRSTRVVVTPPSREAHVQVGSEEVQLAGASLKLTLYKPR